MTKNLLQNFFLNRATIVLDPKQFFEHTKHGVLIGQKILFASMFNARHFFDKIYFMKILSLYTKFN